MKLQLHEPVVLHFPLTLAGPAALELGFDFGVLAVLYALFAHTRRPNGT